MRWSLWEDLRFADEVFIPLKNAFAYLVDQKVVFELERLFFYYNGFALEDESAARFCYDRGPARVYLDAVAEIKGMDLRRIWHIYHGSGDSFVTDSFKFRFGKINGKVFTVDFRSWCDCTDFELGSFVQVSLSNVYVKQSDLDDISEKYSIPKNTLWDGDDNSFRISVLEENNNSEIGHTMIDSSDLPQNLFINFTKLVLRQYPNAKTADLRRNCFEGMEKLNSRDSKIINDLLIRAGATKSKKGEHADNIAWEMKYPKQQWERVFNKKK